LQIQDLPVPADSGRVVLSSTLATGAAMGFPPGGCDGVCAVGAEGSSVGVFDVGTTPNPALMVVPGLAATHEGSTTILSKPDDDHVVLDRWSGDRREVLRVDTRNGVHRVLTVYPAQYWFGDITFALDALARDPVDRPAPPHPWDPRVRWGLVAVSAALGVLGILLWRRRVRA
jgi:hypothetical protein